MPDLLSQNIDAVDKNLALRQFTSYVFKKDSTYYARKHDGSLISSSTTCETVIAAALAAKGDIYIMGDGAGTAYDLSGAFTGFDIPIDTHLHLGHQCNINVPNAYTGYVFRLNDVGFGSSIDGYGYIAEQGSPAKNWKGIRLNSTTGPPGGVSFCRIEGLYLYQPGTGIELISTGSSAFVNGNVFQNIIIDGPRIGVDYQNGGSDARTDGNKFYNILCQSATGVTVNGIKNVDGDNNAFINCDIWDIDRTGTEMNIKATAKDTIIVGGRCTGYKAPFIDLGIRTHILARNRTGVSSVVNTPDNGKVGTWHAASATGGDGLLNGRLTAITVGAGPPTQTVGNDATGNYYTYDTSATINNLSGLRTAVQLTRRALNVYFKTAVYPTSVTNVRVFAGLVASGSAPASAADPLNALEGVALWLDSAVSSAWKIMHNDASGASTVDTTGVTGVLNTLYPVEIYAMADDNSFRISFEGSSYEYTTNIPAATTNLAWWVYMENTTGASRTMRHYYVITRNDK